MKKILSIVLSLAMLLTVFSAFSFAKPRVKHVYEINSLIPGGDFDTDEYLKFYRIGGDDPYHGSTITWCATDGVGHTGCLKMQGDGVNVPCLMFSEAPQMESRKPYYVSVDIFRPEGNNATIYLGSENGRFGNIAATKNGEWETLNGIIWSEGGVNVVRVFNENIVLMSADQYILIDNFYFAPYDVNVNYMKDENFVPGNQVWGGDLDVDLTPQYNVRLEPNSAYCGNCCSWQNFGGVNGSGCIKMNASGNPQDVSCLMALSATKGQCYGYNDVCLKANKTYTASVDVLRPEGTTGNIRLDFEDGSAGVTSTKTGDGTWEHLTFEYTVGESDQHKAFRVFNEGGTLGGDNQYVYIDNFYIGEKINGIKSVISYKDARNSDTGSVKFPAGAGYACNYIWTQLRDTSAVTVTFKIKGTAGQKVAYGYEDKPGFPSYGVNHEYAIKQTGVWETVTATFSAANGVDPASGDHQVNGFPFRIYVAGWTKADIWVDDVTLSCGQRTLSYDPEEFIGKPDNPGVGHGGWLNGAVFDGDENVGDGKIDYIYLNATVPADSVQYGFIFAENEFATDDKVRLAKDGGNPLFVKYCDKKYDVVLEKGVYNTSEITATNLGGEMEDKVISLCWTNMPAYGRFAVRTFTIDTAGNVVYGELNTVTLVEGTSLRPLEGDN